jgi:hypothetical protein
MKRLILFIIMIAGALSSCKKILDKSPTDFIQPSNYYNSENDLNLALAATYDPLGNEYTYTSGLWLQLGICTDEGFYGFSSNAFSAPMFYQFDYTNPYTSGLWQQCYLGIERANLLIANINNPTMNEAKRQAILGEALFLRAYYHFLLVSNYGDVPLKITPTSNVNSVDIPRTPSAAVYAQIVKDMELAETKVNKASVIGNCSHVSQTAVEGMLARVNLYMAGYPLRDQSRYAEVIKWANKVIQSGEHDLRTTYNAAITSSAFSQIFINEMQDIYDVKECMWEIDFYLNNNNTAYYENGKVGCASLACNNLDTGFAGGNIRTTIKLYNLYAAGDKRRDWTICPFYYSSSTATTAVRANYTATNIISREPGKWRRYYEPLSPKKQQYTNGTNFPVLRYSDVLLMLAEAENEVNNVPSAAAYNALNMVRRRGYGLPTTAASAVADAPAAMSQLQFRQYILDERAREFAFEGLRKPDLIRTGNFTSTMSAMVTEINNSNAAAGSKPTWTLGYVTAASSPRYLLLPIPALEINVNNAMTQNPGW